MSRRGAPPQTRPYLGPSTKRPVPEPTTWRSALHVALEVVGVSAGFQLYLWLRRHGRDEVPIATRFWVMAGALIGALVGSRLLGWLEDPHSISTLGLWVSLRQSGRTVIGGLLGGLIATELVKWRLGFRQSTGDQLVYPLLLALAIGRVGCFIGGLEDNTYGLPSELPWAIDFGDGVRRHPTQLYDIVFAGGLALGLWQLERHRPLADGGRFKLFLASYLLFRLGVDALKPYPPVLLGLCTLQLACVAGLLYYWRVFLQPHRLFRQTN